eukprot:600284-Amphidinium_carterae.1
MQQAIGSSSTEYGHCHSCRVTDSADVNLSNCGSHLAIHEAHQTSKPRHVTIRYSIRCPSSQISDTYRVNCIHKGQHTTLNSEQNNKLPETPQTTMVREDKKHVK